MTKRVLLRGRYQTVPLTLLGFDLEAAAAAAPPPPHRRISLAGALQWLRQQEQQQNAQAEGAADGAAAGTACSRLPTSPLQPAVEAALAQLVAYWQLVGTSERLMALHPPPRQALAAAAAVADAVCGQLVDGSFGRQPVPTAEQQQQQAQQQPRQRDSQQQGAAKKAPAKSEDQEAEVKAEEASDVAMGDAEQPASDAPGAQQQDSQPQQGSQAPPDQAQPQQALPQQALLRGEALLSAAADMVLGWCGMLGAGGAGRTASAMRCSAAGLAAAVLLCSCSEGARMLLARWGAVLLDDVLTMPLVRAVGVLSRQCSPTLNASVCAASWWHVLLRR